MLNMLTAYGCQSEVSLIDNTQYKQAGKKKILNNSRLRKERRRLISFSRCITNIQIDETILF
jgi:hypothetical protein